ncbi:MAG TPA: YraN family protein [Solirubrobacteraceae bacterium]|jgi:putative endonuclease|nr:YraN family protein [Solirubrobacteraceae bacterium]
MLSQDSPDPDADAAPAPDPSPSPSEDPRRTLGRLGEDLAVAHFERLGFSALGRNERTRYGEIDLIAFDGATLVFAEVKTRRVREHKQNIRDDQQPLAWLRPRQSERLRELAAAWLYDKQHIRPTAHTIRFDAIGVIVDRKDKLICLDHIEGAW